MKNKHASEHPCLELHKDKPITANSVFELPTHVMGGGLSQSYAALYFLEYYIQLREFDEVIEIGSQQGGLSLFLANYAAVSEWFNFYTFDIDHWAWNTRSNGGVGHWYDKLAKLTSRISAFNLDCFSEGATILIEAIIKGGKTLIICDGGNKTREFNHFAPLIKTGDSLLVHDWNREIFMPEIAITAKKQNMVADSPFEEYSGVLGTTFMPFRKL